MARVMIHCPETGEPVYTGMTFDWSAFETLRIGRRFVGARQPLHSGPRRIDTRRLSA